jgi:hypothetical protein
MAVTNTVGGTPKIAGITVAAHPDASAELDTALGEREIPSLPPPAGVFIVYSIPPSTEYMWLSPLDIRKLRPGKHLEEYTIGMTWNAGSIEVSWGALPAMVDSAYLVDVISDFPNNFIKVKLEPNKTYTTNNTAITKLKVMVWYNSPPSSVLYDYADAIRVYPTPCDDEMFVRGVADNASFEIFDINGERQMHGPINGSDQSISTALLLPGAYVLRVKNMQGLFHTTTILRR